MKRQLTGEDAIEALDNLDDYAKMEVSIDPIGARHTLEQYIKEAEELIKYQAHQLKLLETIVIKYV